MSESYSVYAILLAVVLVQFLMLNGRIAAVERQVGRIFRLDAKLDLLLKHSGVEYDPYKVLPRDVTDALRNRQKILAIKLFREATGLGLKDAIHHPSAAAKLSG